MFNTFNQRLSSFIYILEDEDPAGSGVEPKQTTDTQTGHEELSKRSRVNALVDFKGTIFSEGFATLVTPVRPLSSVDASVAL